MIFFFLSYHIFHFNIQNYCYSEAPDSVLEENQQPAHTDAEKSMGYVSLDFLVSFKAMVQNISLWIKIILSVFPSF